MKKKVKNQKVNVRKTCFFDLNKSFYRKKKKKKKPKLNTKVETRISF